jgi:hypothetical protein
MRLSKSGAPPSPWKLKMPPRKALEARKGLVRAFCRKQMWAEAIAES